MLALAAENKSLQKQADNVQSSLEKQLAQQILRNEELRRENMELRNKMKLQSNQSKSHSGFNVDAVKASPIRDNFKYYTVFTYMRFMCIFQFLVPSSALCPINFPSRLKVAFKMKLQINYFLPWLN